MTKSASNNSVFFTAAMFGFIASHRLEIGKIIPPFALKINCSRSYYGILTFGILPGDGGGVRRDLLFHPP